MRLVLADCSVDYEGELNTHLPRAKRLIMLKDDGSVLIHSDDGSYKPLNWLNPPTVIHEYLLHEDPSGLSDLDIPEGVNEVWRLAHKKSDNKLTIYFYQKIKEENMELSKEPGLVKEGVEADLQRLLSEQIELLGQGHLLIRREYPTAIGPVDILARDKNGHTVAVELKRRGDIAGVEQLTRYLELLNRDPLLAPVRGIYAAQQIKPQAKTLASDRGIECLLLDYETMKETESKEFRLF